MNLIPYLINASEFSLAIALTAFVASTAILLILLISLGASKNFRAVFFREKRQSQKSKKKKSAAVVSEPKEPSEPKAVAEQPKPARQTATRRRGNAEPDYLNAIPTVPLGGIPQAQPPVSDRRSSARMRGSESEPTDEQPRATYTTRSVTITRARSSSVKTAKTEPETDKAETRSRQARKR